KLSYFCTILLKGLAANRARLPAIAQSNCTSRWGHFYSFIHRYASPFHYFGFPLYITSEGSHFALKKRQGFLLTTALQQVRAR
ncbi:MAG: hypothetical protein MI753_16900, partial [Hyphomicrobiales bacterium]|nr:hypothetical protein [Hyphomicrobiales bacterium]